MTGTESPNTPVIASTRPTFTDYRLILEVHSNVKDAPPLIVNRFSLNVFKITVIYRRYSPTAPWEFLQVSVNGTWLDGAKRGKVDHRKYGRSTFANVPDWLSDFVMNNSPRM